MHQLIEELKAMRPEKIETLEDVRLWIADHDGRIDQLWQQQHRINDRTESRVSALERRVIFWAGAAAAAGSILGPLLGRLVGG